MRPGMDKPGKSYVVTGPRFCKHEFSLNPVGPAADILAPMVENAPIENQSASLAHRLDATRIEGMIEELEHSDEGNKLISQLEDLVEAERLAGVLPSTGF